ncbi:MAG TPA: class I SAM-dependent methyltransferase [Candidatus Eisenbacteria bacterium]|jgi:SAM-dependent methyltransferase
MHDEVARHNRRAWDGLVERANRWTVPVDAVTIAAARRGEWEIVLTPTRPVPRAWYPPFAGERVLLLAGAGGQQAPVLAAAGARVSVVDNSPRQLAQDLHVAEREALEIETVLGDMRDLSAFADGTFALVFHPCSNAFVPDVRPVWREAFRVLRPGGVLLAGFTNPVEYLFDEDAVEGTPAEHGSAELIVRHAIPYSDLARLAPAERARREAAGEPLAFGHSLEDQLGGQLDAGFVITALYEDRWPESPLGRYLATFMATRAVRPAS